MQNFKGYGCSSRALPVEVRAIEPDLVFYKKKRVGGRGRWEERGLRHVTWKESARCSLLHSLFGKVKVKGLSRSFGPFHIHRSS